tara:strand:- start:10005 stop:10469 length:465 start_codon:yes stop_codon:yes gene_type:complete
VERRKPLTPVEWEIKFNSKLKKFHGTHTKSVFHKLMRKSSNLISNLRKRSKEYAVKCNVTLDEIRYMLYNCYGKECRYCKQLLKISNIACDHKQSISNGGDSVKKNLQMICRRCNTRKGPLSNKEYLLVVNWLNKQSESIRIYVNRKLAGKNAF